MPLKFPPVLRLKRRPDFLRAAAGDRFHARAFSLQATAISPNAEAGAAAAEPEANLPPAVQPPRFGITVTKRIGGAVERNRIKRRFKEALRLSSDLPARPGRDYVVVAKAEALTMDFQSLRSELANAIRKIDRPTRQRTPKPKAGRR
jgi:ribonuclease P protein component